MAPVMRPGRDSRLDGFLAELSRLAAARTGLVDDALDRLEAAELEARLCDAVDCTPPCVLTLSGVCLEHGRRCADEDGPADAVQ